ncbi:MAG: hypothetical protein KKA79_07250 [Nanoarchaeota archaeon]|nr:hypothetical protein [Nanoarchaeota archaeon]
MQVHFGGSSEGFRKYPELYKLINDKIKSLGHDVSNEWVHDTKSGDETFVDKFRGTLEGIVKSDALVLEKTIPSLEVGQQYHMGLERNLPVLFLHYNRVTRGRTVRPAKTQDTMHYLVDPAKVDSIYVAEYNRSTVGNVLEAYLNVVEEKHRRARFNLVLERNLDNYLRKVAAQNNTSKSEEIRRLIIESMNRS